MTTPSSPLLDRWRRLRGSDRFAECLRVFLALGGVTLYCLAASRFVDAIPALLGVIACALAETEDHWRSRLGTLLITLVCFTVAAFAVQWLLPYPPLFALGLPLATFGMVMLGAVSGRYATIAGATLLLSVYTMIGTDAETHPGSLREPALLLAGAAWYGVLSLLWSALSPQHAVRHALARTFDALANYLEEKAALFAPVRGVDREALQPGLAMRNEKVVQALNETRLVLIDRIGPRRPRGSTAARLRLYFAAQDIHERVSSSHYPYDALAEAFFHSDVLFRCEHLLRLHAGLCRRRAEALRQRVQFKGDKSAGAALEDVRTSLEALYRQAQPPAAHLLRSLDALVRNMSAIQQLLAHETPLAAPAEGTESALQDPGPQHLGEAWERIRIQFTARSFRFRHALRLALALLAGYGVLHLVHPRNGYWILLTTLLVCQPSYGATRRRLLQRVAGTLVGLLAGWAALRLLPFGPAQVPLLIVTGVGFFAMRHRQYTTATAAITLFVVLCFNQVGRGYEVMWPRLLDTLIGAGIAALAIHVILPDWQGRRFNQVLADTLRCDARYLARILDQYTSGKRDDLDYRIARRDAHNADATLSGVLSNMLREPGRHRQGSEALLRFLGTAHTLLGHLSALGANRQALTPGAAHDVVTRTGEQTIDALDRLAHALATRGTAMPNQHEHTLAEAFGAIDTDDETARLVLGQLALVLAQCDRLAALAKELPAE
ncbi:TIGR01666 family membrane protein [Dyella sp. OK004]|uniref:YccS family putative transporter n=1 Tax=Dyella sp. OK004 TaxID=1855292 RepID=UPI0008F09B82|nr:YccS family putative transporter [Dyella sp. OK004]SFS18684.1 TIGR01666 family membrane protein [Dyella sp. OK004]